MKIRLSIILGALLLGLSISCPALANANPAGSNGAKSFIHTGNENVSKEIRNLVYLHTKYSNEFKVDKLQNLYSSDYINADGMGKEKLFKLVNDTWKNYPDIKYASQIKEIKISPKYVVVFSSDKATATTAKKSEITNDYGELFSTSENVMYFKKVGRDWKIFAEKVLSEKTSLRYGCAKKIQISMEAPESVNPSDEYTVSLRVNKAPNTVVVSSIASEPIVFPEVHSKEAFRQLNDKGLLERVIKANATNNNEMAVASLGFTETYFDIYQNTRLKVTGLALIMQRVNVNNEKLAIPSDLSK